MRTRAGVRRASAAERCFPSTSPSRLLIPPAARTVNAAMIRGMGASRREVEIKLRFPTIEAAATCLRSAGATPVSAREREDNVLYDRAVAPLGREGRALRLRRVGGRAILTLKSPVPEDHAHKVRIERETSVGEPEAMSEVLVELGFSPVYRYQKYRSTFEVDDVAVFLDETPLGCFLELEGEAAAIDRLAARLGFGPKDYILESYRELHRDAVVAGSALPGDLLLPDGDGAEP